LPEDYRFSRAMILIGSFIAATGMAGLRLLLHFALPKKFQLHSDALKRLLIVGDAEEGVRVLSLLKLSGTQHNFIGFVQPDESVYTSSLPEYRQFLLGSIGKLPEMAEVFSPDEIIFCAKDISSQVIIRQMGSIGGRDIEFKIAPPESMFIIGSSDIDDPGELYAVDINSISKSTNRRNKRLLDLGMSLLFLLTVPLLIIFQKDPSGFIRNLLNVISGKLSWVGFDRSADQEGQLPATKAGILHPSDAIKSREINTSSLHRLNTLYAKDYQVSKDLYIMWKGVRNLGRKAVSLP
ncbi:MAG: nucleoside-diphosphate sugar epimerase/dehydratase, partial [Bacteroidota bacterium]